MRHCHAIAGCLSLVFAGCAQDQEPLTASISRTYLMGDAAAALDSSGSFRPILYRPWSREEVSEVEATLMADEYLRRFVRPYPSRFERRRGAPIDGRNLKRCGRPLYAESPYEEPAPDMNEAVVNFAASRWIFPYCDMSGPAVSIAVAASATRLRVVDGRWPTVSFIGGEFDALGIPMGTIEPMSPETAARMLGTATGKRVATIPRLVLAGVGHWAQAAHWMMQLEDTAESSDAHGARRSERTYFVGRSLRTEEREIARASVPRAADTLRGRADTIWVLHRRAGHQARWERVAFGKKR
jgi:hypothetical protein